MFVTTQESVATRMLRGAGRGGAAGATWIFRVLKNHYLIGEVPPARAKREKSRTRPRARPPLSSTFAFGPGGERARLGAGDRGAY